MGRNFSRSIWLALILLLPNCIRANSEDSQNFVPPDIETPSLTISKQVDEVSLVFTAMDKRGRFIKNLPQDAFELLDNSKAPEAVRFFQQQSNLPLHVAVLVDLSDSVKSRFKFEQEAASVFLKKILRPGKDEAFIVGFDDRPHLEQDLTSNVEKLSKAIHTLSPGGDTGLYDAVIYACKKLEAQSGSNVVRRAIILISDGVDTASRTNLQEAVLSEARAQTLLYAVRTNNPATNPLPLGQKALVALTDESGGHILPGVEKADLTRSFSRIEAALRSQYALGYRPADFAADGSYRSVQLSAKMKGVKVQCRKGYFAAAKTQRESRTAP